MEFPKIFNANQRWVGISAILAANGGIELKLGGRSDFIINVHTSDWFSAIIIVHWSFHCRWKKAVRLKPLCIHFCSGVVHWPSYFIRTVYKTNGNMSLGSGIGFQDVHIVSDQKSPNMTCHDYAIIMVIWNCKVALGDVQNIHEYTCGSLELSLQTLNTIFSLNISTKQRIFF